MSTTSSTPNFMTCSEIIQQEGRFVLEYARHYGISTNLTRSEILERICALHPGPGASIPILPHITFEHINGGRIRLIGRVLSPEPIAGPSNQPIVPKYPSRRPLVRESARQLVLADLAQRVSPVPPLVSPVSEHEQPHIADAALPLVESEPEEDFSIPPDENPAKRLGTPSDTYSSDPPSPISSPPITPKLVEEPSAQDEGVPEGVERSSDSKPLEEMLYNAQQQRKKLHSELADLQREVNDAVADVIGVQLMRDKEAAEMQKFLDRLRKIVGPEAVKAIIEGATQAAEEKTSDEDESESDGDGDEDGDGGENGDGVENEGEGESESESEATDGDEDEDESEGENEGEDRGGGEDGDGDKNQGESDGEDGDGDEDEDENGGEGKGGDGDGDLGETNTSDSEKDGKKDELILSEGNENDGDSYPDQCVSSSAPSSDEADDNNGEALPHDKLKDIDRCNPSIGPAPETPSSREDHSPKPKPPYNWGSSLWDVNPWVLPLKRPYVLANDEKNGEQSVDNNGDHSGSALPSPKRAKTSGHEYPVSSNHTTSSASRKRSRSENDDEESEWEVEESIRLTGIENNGGARKKPRTDINNSTPVSASLRSQSHDGPSSSLDESESDGSSDDSRNQGSYRPVMWRDYQAASSDSDGSYLAYSEDESKDELEFDVVEDDVPHSPQNRYFVIDREGGGRWTTSPPSQHLSVPSIISDSGSSSLDSQSSHQVPHSSSQSHSQPEAGPSNTRHRARGLTRARERLRPTASGGIEAYNFDEGPDYEYRLEREAESLAAWRRYEAIRSSYPFTKEFEVIRRAKVPPLIIFEGEEEVGL